MSEFDDILDLFRQEASDHLQALEKGFLDLELAESMESQESILNDIFRHAHGLKGAARAVELKDIQQCAQSLEDTLDGFREQESTLPGEAIKPGLTQFDELRRVLNHWQSPPDSTKTVPETRDPVRAAGSDNTFTVRVSSDRLDRMLSLAGELRISQRSADFHAQQLDALEKNLEEGPISEKIPSKQQAHLYQWQSAMRDQLHRIRTELHNKQVREELLLGALESDIHEARLLPLSMLAESLRRAVRDLAQSLGKVIRYEIDVGTVLLDKAVIESLKDPLLHLIRNAAHHGIESPAARVQAGKPEEGRIRLRAWRRGDRVNIEVSDDGGGLDYDKILLRVQRSGLVEDSELATLEESDLASFIFQPGFTTSLQPDEISGRGVGLDAVYDVVRRLQGSIEIPGSTSAGTSFVMAVPVTISTIRILTVSSGGQYYGIPSSSILRTARIQPTELISLQGNPILTVDGEPVPWIELSELIGADSKGGVDSSQSIPYVLTSHEGRRLAIGVDDTEDELEVILKPLGYPLTGIPGIVGGTIRPDGSVQLVLDMTGTVFRMRHHHPNARSVSMPRQILVVDDSPVTRTMVRNVLANAGYMVETAGDGVEALERLQAKPMDLVVSDVQMPRMNGFQLTRQIKSQWNFPVILVTSLDKESHRREGLGAGADAYLVKSTFEGKGLLEIVRQLVGHHSAHGARV